jgi:8-oxo-dGTP diphosphatase
MRKEFGAKLDGIDYAVRQGAYAVVFNPAATQVMTVRNARGHHFLPGGGIENGESHAECLEREFLEETGYQIIVGDCIGNASRYFHSPEAGAWMSDGHFYMAELAHKAQEPAEDDHGIEWLDTEQAKQQLIEHHGWAVAEAVRRLKRRKGGNQP